MEGPSIFLAAEQLAPFIGKTIKNVTGNTHKISKERMVSAQILDIFPCGKQLFFQFNSFALRVHFMLYGSFAATIDTVKITGDYPKKNRSPRLAFCLDNGHLELYSCSVNFVESFSAKELCDFTADIMSPQFDEKQALKKLKSHPEAQIADAMLDQQILAGVGNIIKNEVLFLMGIMPTCKIKDINTSTLKLLLNITRNFVIDFYIWRKSFELKTHYKIYRQSICKQCGFKVQRLRTGLRKRFSYICHHCQS